MTQSKPHCVPCEEGSAPLSAAIIADRLAALQGWALIEDGKKIIKKFKFKDFKDAMAFQNEAGDVAEFEGHHPDLFLHDWNKVDVSLSTHASKGLTDNDFIMAGLIDRVIADRNS
jgi:4a-hydroxytetrahydrobiopterin dehydratase